MSKSEKRQRQKEMRRQKIEQEIRAHRAARRKRMGVNLTVLAVIVGIIAFLIVRAGSDVDPSASSSPSPGAEQEEEAPEVACGGTVPDNAGEQKPSFGEPPAMQIDQSKTYTATIETSCGPVVMELADDQAPQTVNSFVFLAEQGYFDGLTFHRVVPGFAIQGGDPVGDGTGGPGYKVTEAPPEGLTYERGVVAMAKAGNEPPGTSGSQFFIVPGDGAASLPPEYALLGRVVDGLETLQKIEQVPLAPSAGGEESSPRSKIYILKVSISTS